MQGMQNVVNYIVPFFGKDGKPLSGGRVHFVKPDCSAAPTDREDPDYIAIFDTDGTARKRSASTTSGSSRRSPSSRTASTSA